MRLKGKLALITGASRGIGRGIALRFAREGADVAINFRRSAQKAERLAEEIKGLGRKAILVQADISKVDEGRKLVESAWAQFGRLDILVNNAGISEEAAFWDVTEEDFDKVINTDLKGAFFVTQALVRKLRAAGSGASIINISSVHEELPFPGHAPYCAAKGGLKSLTHNLAVELGPLGIRVNAIAPGAIKTNPNQPMHEDPRVEGGILKKIPVGRLGLPEDVGALAAFLASDDAAYLTGSTHYVDGGLSRYYEE